MSSSNSWKSSALCAICCLFLCTVVVSEDPLCHIESQGTTFNCLPAQFSSNLAEKGDAPTLSIIAADPPEGCSLQASLPANSVLLVARGNCTFVRKAELAAQAGAAAVIIRNTLEGMYLSATNYTPPDPTLRVGVCDYDCALGSTSVQPADATPQIAYNGYHCGGSCASGMCALDGNKNSDGTLQACCVLDDLMAIGGTWQSTTPAIPTVFVTISEGQDLYARTQGGGATARIFHRPVSAVNLSSFLIWALGCTAAFIAAWRSGSRERAAVKAVRTGVRLPPPSGPAPVEMAITMPQALAFLACASIMLVVLYLLIQAGFNVVLIIICIFSLGAISSTTTMVWGPLFGKLFPSLNRRTYEIWQCGTVTYAQTAGFVVAVLVVLFWFLERHSDWAWVLQDFFGMALCCLFILTLRLPSLRVATGLLVLFFFYDIFMVFITPYIFKTSVMVEVATAGLPPEFANRECYCRLHPDDSKMCGPGETMPILLLIPRINTWTGGYSMLGLGDIAIPGMLLSFLLRWDLVNHGRLKWGYFAIAMPGYCIGLMLANAAVIITHLGQPALLYLVPCTLAPVSYIAYKRNELRTLWRGASIGAPREERREPLVDGGNAAAHEVVALTSGVGPDGDGAGAGDDGEGDGARRDGAVYARPRNSGTPGGLAQHDGQGTNHQGITVEMHAQPQQGAAVLSPLPTHPSQ